MIENQVTVFLWTIMIGAILGFVFDFFRILRRKGNTKDIMVYLQDVVFWLIVTIVIIVSTFLINDGELRGYMLFGYILGAVFYILLFSNFIRKTFSFLFDSIEKIFKVIAGKVSNVVKKIKFTNKNNKKLEN